MLEVYQLVVGYAREQEQGYTATGSVSLVITDDYRILVDCGDPWNSGDILEALVAHDLSSDLITHLVITHGHIDHCGNISLFQNATVFMMTDLATNGFYDTLKEDSPYSICPSVDLQMFKGHTECDLVVFVKDTKHGVVCIAGDLFENGNDEEEWQLMSRYPEEHRESRKSILEIADYIIPGHGPMFRNKLNC